MTDPSPGCLHKILFVFASAHSSEAELLLESDGISAGFSGFVETHGLVNFVQILGLVGGRLCP